MEDIISDEERDRIVSKLHEILRPFVLRRLKKDVLAAPIPTKRDIVVYCGMSSLQREYYAMVRDGTLRDNLVAAGVEGAKGISQINANMNLRKVCNHPFLFGDLRDTSGRRIRETSAHLLVAASGKFKLLDRMLPRLQRERRKVLLYSQMTSVSVVENCCNISLLMTCIAAAAGHPRGLLLPGPAAVQLRAVRRLHQSR